MAHRGVRGGRLVAGLHDGAQPGRQVVQPVRDAVRAEHLQAEHAAAEEDHDVPGVGRTRPGVAVGGADGVLLGARDTGGGEEEPVLHHRLGHAALHHGRKEFAVELPLVVQGARDEPGRALGLGQAGVLEQEEEVGVERDPVPAAQVAVRPEGVEPAVHAVRGVVLLQGRVQRPAGPVGPRKAATSASVAASSSGPSSGAHQARNLSQLASSVGSGTRGRLSSLAKVVAPWLAVPPAAVPPLVVPPAAVPPATP